MAMYLHIDSYTAPRFTEIVNPDGLAQGSGDLGVDGGQEDSKTNSYQSQVGDTVELSKDSTTDKVKEEENQSGLTEEEKKEVQHLKEIARNVKAHEQAHRQVGGDLIRGSISYQYKKGPDGQMYQISGEVMIDTSEVRNDPAATAMKMDRVQKTALAPANPSATDRSVAAKAGQKEVQARAEASAETRDENSRDTDSEEDKDDAARAGSRTSVNSMGSAGRYYSSLRSDSSGELYEMIV